MTIENANACYDRLQGISRKQFSVLSQKWQSFSKKEKADFGAFSSEGGQAVFRTPQCDESTCDAVNFGVRLFPWPTHRFTAASSVSCRIFSIP